MLAMLLSLWPVLPVVEKDTVAPGRTDPYGCECGEEGRESEGERERESCYCWDGGGEIGQ